MCRRLFALVVVTLLLVSPSAPALAQEEGFPLPDLEPITAENAAQIEQLVVLGPDEFYELAWSPGGETLAVASLPGVWVYDTEDFESEPRLLEGFAYNVVYSPDGTILASWGRGDRPVRLWNMTTGELLTLLKLKEHTDLVFSVAFSLDGAVLASGSSDHTVRLWDVATGEQLAVLEGHIGGVFSVVFSPDGAVLASGGGHRDNKARLWNVATGEQLAVLEGHTDAVLRVVFSPDGTVLASASRDNTVRLWDVATGEQLAVLEGHTEYVQGVAFSPNGTVLASGGNDNTVRLWDAATGKQLSVLECDTDAEWTDIVWNLAFSPDGTMLASVHPGKALLPEHLDEEGDSTVRLWGIPAGE